MDMEATLTELTSEIGVQDITEMVWSELDLDFQTKDVIFGVIFFTICQEQDSIFGFFMFLIWFLFL